MVDGSRVGGNLDGRLADGWGHPSIGGQEETTTGNTTTTTCHAVGWVPYRGSAGGPSTMTKTIQRWLAIMSYHLSAVLFFRWSTQSLYFGSLWRMEWTDGCCIMGCVYVLYLPIVHSPIQSRSSPAPARELRLRQQVAPHLEGMPVRRRRLAQPSSPSRSHPSIHFALYLTKSGFSGDRSFLAPVVPFLPSCHSGPARVPAEQVLQSPAG